jgi:2'-5' RNA ligase
VRAFVAVELPEAVRSAIAAAAAPILAQQPDVKPVAEDNLHITIRFLGDVTSDRLPAVQHALSEAASDVPAADARVVAFEKQRWNLSPQVWCAHVDDRPARVLTALEREVTPRIAPLGFPPESRRFLPHITVGRSRRRGRRKPWHEGKERDCTGQYAKLMNEPVGPSFPVRELTLFESELTPRGSRYSALARFPLQPIPTKEQP